MATNILSDNSGITFINLYDKDNPILEIGDDCYFLFFNAIDFFAPIIGKGTIIYDRFNETINKVYFISISEIISSKEVKDKYFFNQQIQLYPFNKENLQISNKHKTHKFVDEVFDKEFFDENLIKIECFYVRNNLEKILELRDELVDIILDDTQNQLNQIKEFKTLH